MSDVRRLLAIKANIETTMQRGLLDPHTRVFAQQQLDKVCKKIEEARAEWEKLFEPQELDQLLARVKELEASNAVLLEALDFCCTNNCERKLWYKQNRTTPPFDMPKEKCIDCPVMETIEKTKGLLNG